MPPIFTPKLTPPLVLSFAASDPTGGAGIQADLLTLASMGCHPLSVITALTVQDTAGVDEILVIDSEWVMDQARMLLEDVPVAAFKLGMLGSPESIAVIAEILADYPDIPVVLDPVLASGRGDELATDDMIAAMRDLLIPQTSILTPNSHEARRLALFESDEDDLDLAACAKHLTDLGCEYVLITGTHEATPRVLNSLYDANGHVQTDAWDRLPGSYHGSGCTLASAIAATLAYGQDVPCGRARSAELHLRNAESRLPPRHGAIHPGAVFLGTGCPDGRQCLILAMLDFPGGVYAITPETADTGKLLAQVEAALSGGVAAVQYRDKSTDVARRHEQASELVALCRRFNVPLIVNDDLRLADLCDADGVHLGRDDGSLREARIILGRDKLIGASCYQSLDTGTRCAGRRRRLRRLRQLLSVAHQTRSSPGGRRFVACRRRKPSTCRLSPSAASRSPTRQHLLDAGADSLAVLSALFDAPDIRAAAHAPESTV